MSSACLHVDSRRSLMGLRGIRATQLMFALVIAALIALVGFGLYLRGASQALISQATQGNVTVAASPDPVHAGETLKISWTIHGPAKVWSSCQEPNPQLWAVSPSGSRIGLTHPALCQSGSGRDLNEGESETDWVYWNIPSGFAPGIYSIHGRLAGFPVPRFSDENLPVLTIRVVGNLGVSRVRSTVRSTVWHTVTVAYALHMHRSLLCDQDSHSSALAEYAGFSDL